MVNFYQQSIAGQKGEVSPATMVNYLIATLAKLISLILKIFPAPRYFSGDLNSESQDSAVQDKGTTL
jgi:hypothetical protein